MQCKSNDINSCFFCSSLIFCLSTNGVMAWVAHLEGEIRHPEITQTENKINN